jgi:uncharacterized membrane protein YfcA
MLPLELLLGFGIGVTLGLLGGGGSILTVPALVYLLGRDPRAAVTASMAIVGLNSLSGLWMRRSAETLNVRVAAVFGSVGMAASFATSQLSKQFDGVTLLIAFSVLMLIVGASMLLLKPPAPRSRVEPISLSVLLAGAGVGALTGLLGVGGGFLIVPALVMIVGLPMRQAIGTSLMVIAMNSLAGLLGHFGEAVDVRSIAVFAAAGIVGTLAGTRLAARIAPEKLRSAFAVFVLALASVLLYDNVSRYFGL